MTVKKTNSTKGLETLFLDALKDIYYAEKKITKALPKMAKGAKSKELSAAFEKHLAETEAQIERLEQVFELIGKPARGKTCPAIDGILEGGGAQIHNGGNITTSGFASTASCPEGRAPRSTTAETSRHRMLVSAFTP